MSNAQKTPVSRTLPLYVNQMIRKFIDRLAKGRPATLVSLDPSGTIATVNFEIAGVTLPQVTMPVAGSEFIRLPLQPGCKGVCLPADFYLGAMTGLGTGTADTTPRGNLSTLVFFPLGNKGFSATDNPNAVVIYGPDGVIIRDTGSGCVPTLTPTGFKVVLGGNSILMNATDIVLTVGAATLTLTSGALVSSVPITAPDVIGTTNVAAGVSLKVAGKEMSGHEHDVVGVQTGSSTIVSSPPI